MSTTTRPVRLLTGTILSLLAIVLTGCAGAVTVEPSVTPTPAAAAAFGPVQRATGAPVAVGFMGVGLSADPSEPTRAATAVAGYANTYLGGLGGHSVQVVPCEDRGTPAGAQACGEQFVREGVVAVAVSTSSQVDSMLPAVRDAGIPVLVNLAGTEAVLRSPGVFVLRNPLSLYGTAAGYARARDLGAVVVVIPDVPSAAGPARALAPPLFANAGGTATVLAVALNATDFGPQIEDAERTPPDMYLVAGDVNFCAAAISAIREAGSTARVVTADNCVGEDRGASIKGGLNGLTIITQSVLDPDVPETVLFTAVRETYGDGLGVSAQSVGGYQTMLSLTRVVNAVKPADVTPATVAAAITQGPPTPYPLGGGAEFACNGQAVPQISPNICSAAGFVATANADGVLSDYQPIDTGGIYRLG